MEKKYEKYFGKNTARIIYLIGISIAFLGVFNVIMGNAYFGSIFCTIGVIIFFLTSHKQVSDKQIDELVQKAEANYKEEKIKGKSIGRQELDPEKFSLFSGFIRDSGEVRFKAGRDQKIRTSRYFVTAVSSEKNDFTVITTVYDIITGQEIFDEMLYTRGTDSAELTREKVEFPRGLYKYTLKTVSKDIEQELQFYMPDDALADTLTERVK